MDLATSKNRIKWTRYLSKCSRPMSVKGGISSKQVLQLVVKIARMASLKNVGAVSNTSPQSKKQKSDTQSGLTALPSSRKQASIHLTTSGRVVRICSACCYHTNQAKPPTANQCCASSSMPPSQYYGLKYLRILYSRLTSCRVFVESSECSG